MILSGKYQLIKPLATGGMGEIYLARMRGIEGFERLVVLKRLKPDVAARADNIAMFLDEVRLLASVQHANVVRIYDVGNSDDGGFFYAMEYLHGQDLRSVMRAVRGNALPTVPLLVSVGASVLSGLHHVHERHGPDGKALHIVHRDVSPANIFVTYEGEVKLLDFGIALAASRTTQTAEGVVKGKFRYMSPEQCRTDPLDRRSDVFALGVVLWEMAVGKSLFKTDSDVKTLFSIVEKDAPRVSSLIPDFPPALDQIIGKALSRPVEQRWQSAREMQLALEEFALEHRISLSSTPVTRVMQESFADELRGWQEAQDAGKDLAAYVAEQAVNDHPHTPSGSSSSGLATMVEPPPNWHLAGRVPQAAGPAAGPVVPLNPSRRTALWVATAALTLLVMAGLGFAMTRPAPVSAPPAPEVSAPVTVAPVPVAKSEPTPVPVEAPPPPVPIPVVVAPPAVADVRVVTRPAEPKVVRRTARPREKPEKPPAAGAEKPAAWDKDSPEPPP